MKVDRANDLGLMAAGPWSWVSGIVLLSVSPLTAFVGALTAVGAEEEEDAESPWDSEVFPVKDTGVPSGAGVGSEIQKHSELGPCRG